MTKGKKIRLSELPNLVLHGVMKSTIRNGRNGCKTTAAFAGTSHKYREMGKNYLNGPKAKAKIGNKRKKMLGTANPQNTPQKGIRELQRQYVRNVILRHKDDEGADWIKYEFTNRNSESELSDCNFDNRWRGSGGQLLTSFGNGIVKPIYIRDVIGTHSKQFLINKYIRNATAFNEKYRCGSKLKSPPHFKKGGRIPKAGIYKLHKGEVVVPSHRVKTVDNALKKSGRSPLKKECKTCILSKKQLSDRKNIKDKLRFYSNTII